MKKYKSLITDKNDQPLRILEVGKHTCIRVIRFATALKHVGYEVDLLTNKISYGTEIFDKVGFYHNKKQFQNWLYENKEKYHIITCHNEPDEMIIWAREVIGKDSKTKLIHNAHDLDNIRRGFIPIPEREAFLAADAIIYVSEPIQKICNRLHSVDVPTRVIYNYPNQHMVDWFNFDNIEDLLNRKKTLVYEGGVNAIDDSPQSVEINRVFSYRNLFHLFKQLVEQGNEVHVHPGNLDAFQTGQNTGCVLYKPMPFDKLLSKISEYKYNLLVFNNEGGTENQVNYTTPNKLWDGLCSGLPSIACYCEETEKYVEKHGIGWRFNSLKDVRDCSHLEDDYKNKLNRVLDKRKELVFENQIVISENLYAELLNVTKKQMPNNIRKQLEFEYGIEGI